MFIKFHIFGTLTLFFTLFNTYWPKFCLFLFFRRKKIDLYSCFVRVLRAVLKVQKRKAWIRCVQLKFTFLSKNQQKILLINVWRISIERLSLVLNLYTIIEFFFFNAQILFEAIGSKSVHQTKHNEWAFISDYNHQFMWSKFHTSTVY